METSQRNLTERYLEKKMRMESLGKLFEINLGCFGGADATIYKQAWKESMNEYISYLKNLGDEDNIKKAKSIIKYFEKLSDSEPENARNLFEKSLLNIAESIVNAANGKEIFVVVTNTEYIEPEEEDYTLTREIAIQLAKKQNITEQDKIVEFVEGYINDHAIDAETYISKIETGEIVPQQTFIYDDFTPNELVKYYEQKHKSNHKDNIRDGELERIIKYSESIFGSANSLYPRALEDFTDKDFPKTLKANDPSMFLIRQPIYGENINESNLKGLQLKDKVLKTTGENSGDGVFFYKKDFDRGNIEERKNYFNEQTILDLKKQEQVKFILEEKTKGGVTMQPIDLQKQKDGTSVAKFGKLQEYAVDIRFGFEYDPKTDSIKALSSYGRFAHLGEKNNISKGGGVVEIKVVKDENFEELNHEMRNMILGQEKEDGQYFHQLFSKKLAERGFKNKGIVIPFAPLPYLVSESTFKEMEETALYLARKMQEKRLESEPGNISKFIFALDAFANPHPDAYKVK